VTARELGIAQAGALKAMKSFGDLRTQAGFRYQAGDGFDTHVSKRRAVEVLESLVRLGLAERTGRPAFYPAYQITDAGLARLEEL
jgi:hypothetical protein